MMEIYGTIQFKLILSAPCPAFSRSRLPEPALQPLPECDGCSLPPPTAFSAGARMETCLRTRMNKINGLEEKNDVSSNFE